MPAKHHGGSEGCRPWRCVCGGGFLEEAAAGCAGPGLAFAERIMWKCMSQGIEAPSRMWRKQRQAEMTEQETADCRQSPRVQMD